MGWLRDVVKDLEDGFLTRTGARFTSSRLVLTCRKRALCPRHRRGSGRSEGSHVPREQHGWDLSPRGAESEAAPRCALEAQYCPRIAFLR